jgi:hypothetical protein
VDKENVDTIRPEMTKARLHTLHHLLHVEATVTELSPERLASHDTKRRRCPEQFSRDSFDHPPRARSLRRINAEFGRHDDSFAFVTDELSNDPFRVTVTV